MSKHKTGTSRTQTALLPPTLEDYAVANSVVRLIDAYVNGLDMAALHFTHSAPAHTGASSYDAADLLKLAMVRLARPVVPGARMVLTVHDELAFEVPAEAAEEAAAKVREAMETVFPLDVPLVVDVGHGPTWADAH